MAFATRFVVRIVSCGDRSSVRIALLLGTEKWSFGENKRHPKGGSKAVRVQRRTGDPLGPTRRVRDVGRIPDWLLDVGLDAGQLLLIQWGHQLAASSRATLTPRLRAVRDARDGAQVGPSAVQGIPQAPPSIHQPSSV